MSEEPILPESKPKRKYRRKPEAPPVEQPQDPPQDKPPKKKRILRKEQIEALAREESQD
jgi:hypothetical protein